MRRDGEGIDERSNYIMYHKGTAGYYGVGFLVKSKHKNKILEFIGVSNRLAILRMKIPGNRKELTIIQVYAPTQQASKDEIETFYNNLTDEVKKYSHNNLVVMGDFNAQVGPRQEGEESIMGNFGHGKRSINGHKLIGFLHENNLILMNSMFKKKEKNKWTWISPDGRTKNEIDFILSNNAKQFSDTSVIQNLNFNTNHRMVRSSMNYYPPKNSRKSFNNKATKNLSELGPINFKLLTEIVKSTRPLAEKYREVEKNLTQVSNMDRNKTKTHKLSETTIKLMEERKAIISEKNSKNRMRITNLSKRIRENIRNDRKQRRLRTIEEHIIKTGGTKKALKELREKGKEWIPKLKKAQTNLTNRTGIQKVATEYYQALYCNESSNSEQENIQLLDGLFPTHESDAVPPILVDEVKKAMNSQKLDKSPGPDKIPNTLMRGTVEELSQILTVVFNEILRTGTIPNQWGESDIILIHKKGAKDNIGNYRPISLMSNIYKVFAKVKLDRISKTLDECQPIEQAGFRKDFSTIDHIHTVKQVMQKYKEFRKPLFIAFIDYSKAFDSLNHTCIWTSLKQQGVHEVYVEIIRRIYTISKSRIRLESTGKTFPIQRGVRQGDPLSPKLFSAVLEQIFRKLEWEHFGLNINGIRLNHLRFADDIVLFEENPKELECMLTDLAKQSKAVGLALNSDKTKLMTNSRIQEITVNGYILDYVEEYVYLGQIISFKDQMDKEIEKRI